MAPRFDPTKMAALRLGKGLSHEDLARKSGINETTLARWERGVNAPQGRNLAVLAKTLGVEPSALHATPSPPAKPTKAGMRRASKLDELRPFDRDEGELRWNGELVPQLTARALNRVKSSYVLYADAKRRFWIEGVVAREHGLPPVEAAALGTRSGVGARFLIVRALAGDAEMAVTVHSSDAKQTMALHEVPEGKPVRLVVEVATTESGELVFGFFDSEALRPFALRIVGVATGGGKERRGRKRSA